MIGDSPKKTILVTGGCGFIGHQVSIQLCRLGHEVHVIDTLTNYNHYETYQHQKNILIRQESLREVDVTFHSVDITNSRRVNRLFKEVTPDIVVHMASVPIASLALLRPIYLTNQLMDGTVALLEAARAEACERFVYISSSMVYGDFLADEIDEEHRCEPVELYGSMKLGCERVVRLYTKHFDLDHTIIRPTAVYGPTGNEGFVITKFISAAINSGVIRVFGDEVRLDFTYLDDAARGIVLATTSNNGINQTFNIARGESARILDAAQHIQKLAPGVEVILEPKDPLYPRRGTLDISKAGRLLDFKPDYSLEDGLDAFYAHAERAFSTT